MYRLYEDVVIPEAVATELTAMGSPNEVRPNVLARLETTNFYVDEALLKNIFGRWLRE